MMFTKTVGFNDAGRDSPILLTFSLTTRVREAAVPLVWSLLIRFKWFELLDVKMYIYVGCSIIMLLCGPKWSCNF